MGLETGNYISDLVITNPDGADSRVSADDHLRLIKKAAKNTVAGYLGGVIVTGTDGGAVNAYTVANSLPSLTDRVSVVFSPTITNTGASTININSRGAKSIKRVDGAELAAGDLAVGSIYVATYNGTEFRLLAPTKQYVDQLAFSAALPSQSGNGGKIVTTDGATASWTGVKTVGGSSILGAGDIPTLPSQSGNTGKFLKTDGTSAAWTTPSFVLLATLSPTAAANLDALSVFTTAYDNYMIIGDGIKNGTGTDDSLAIRFAVDGAVDTSSSYYLAASNSSSSVANPMIYIASGIISSGRGACFGTHVFNVNATTQLKGGVSRSVQQNSATPGFTGTETWFVHNTTSALSGVRFLWNAGNSFAATGKIYIYGYNNT